MSTKLNVVAPVRKKSKLHNGQSMPHPLMRVFKGLVLTIACAAIVLPFVGIISTSFAGQDQITRAGGLVLWPEEFSLQAYESVFAGGVVSKALGVSIFVTTIGTALSLITTALLAYALSRPNMVGRGPMMMLVLFSLLFTPGMIPTYLAVKQFGLIDSLWALIIPTMVSGFNVIVLRSFFMGLPRELFDSAKLDGASEWQILRRIVLPLSKAILAVVGLFYGVGYWNSFFTALLYLNDSGLWPLQMVVRAYVVGGSQLSPAELGNPDVLPPQPAIQMAILMISIIPIVCVYPFLQKHFAKGVLTGAVKG
ncbi:carbohydrate ABC transporter permease [Arthrobacter sp. GMC3]|uniref:carbohydrate ABC transporter permease n=1 Tax=Arthrobacter sp. GMC3 TaxID=2058894 RepID=UPI0021583C02|nr:carbohydrate ABC transporter permease [Arthrobacter sp. GMC3]